MAKKSRRQFPLVPRGSAPTPTQPIETEITGLGDRLRYFREQRDVTAPELAALVGVKREVIDRIEANVWLPPLRLTVKIAEALQMSLDYLALGKVIDRSRVADPLSVADTLFPLGPGMLTPSSLLLGLAHEIVVEEGDERNAYIAFLHRPRESPTEPLYGVAFAPGPRHLQNVKTPERAVSVAEDIRASLIIEESKTDLLATILLLDWSGPRALHRFLESLLRYLGHRSFRKTATDLFHDGERTAARRRKVRYRIEREDKQRRERRRREASS